MFFKCLPLILMYIVVLFQMSFGINMPLFRSDYKEWRSRFRCSTTLCTPPDFLEPDDYEPGGNEYGCCSECSCDADCVLDNSCCPDYFTEIEPEAANQSAMYSCIDAYVQRPSEVSDTYWLISKCSDLYLNDSVIRQCEAPNDDDLQAKLPVSNNLTASSYRNKFCAQCNLLSEEEYEFWKIGIECQTGAFFPRSQATILTDLKRPRCSLYFEPTFSDVVQPCASVISSCNLTGLWETYDSSVEEACHAYRAVFQYGGQLYGNVFCYVCNMAPDEVIDPFLCMPVTPVPDDTEVSFTALFDFRPGQYGETDSEAVTKDDCPAGYVYDPYKDTCREMLCPPLTVSEDHSCRPAFVAADGICSQAFVRLSTLANISQWNGSTFENMIHQILTEDALSLYNTELSWNKTFIEFYVPKLLSEETGNGNDSMLHLGVYFKLKDSNETVQQLLTLDQTKVNLTVGDEVFEFLFQLDSWMEDDTKLVPDDLEAAAITARGNVSVCNTSSVLLIGPLLQCQATVVSRSEFNWTKTSSGILLDELNWHLRNVDFAYTDSTDSITLCLSSYRKAIEGVMNGSTDRVSLSRQFDSVAGTLSLACTCASLICLGITLVTYSAFQELRTIPGKNNMALALCLFIGQGLFQFGYNKTQIRPLCKAIGLLIHFFILLALFWMHACSYHMFSVFRTIRLPTRQRGPGNKAFMTYVVYTVLMSTIILLVNVSVTLYRSGGKDLGYGNDLCYISLQYMVAYTATLPAMLIVLSNVIFFVLVMYFIHKMPEVHSETIQTRNYFFIYIKLSTITGLAYLLAVPLFLAYHPVVEYIYIVLNASQGVFIMFAFLVNKQVKVLIVKMFRRKKHPPLPASVSNQTARESFDNVITAQ